MLLIMEPADDRRTRTEQEGRVLYQRMLRYTEASECPAAEWATLEVRGFGPCYDGNRME